ncbi:hypothetical protein SAMN05216416_0706 [Streptococcus equinus]|nr:hypothetical protein SAMN05216346_101551 [Streptococcus equinus]SFR66505.1 hypothetical protein SAMN05216416_0706 [Streptococcus equinus]
MKKTKILSALTVCGLALTMSNVVFADTDDVSGTLDDSTEVVVTPSTSGSGSSTGSQTEVTTGDDISGTIDDGSSTVIDVPNTPSDSSNEQTVPTVDEDKVGETTNTETQSGSSEDNKTDVVQEGDKTTEIKQNEDGTVTVPTIDGGQSTLTPDKTQATDDPNISAQTAKEAGASQVGTTSQVTGQVVRDVTTDNPVTLTSGQQLLDIQSGVATLSDGSKVNLVELGATENEDGTFSVTTNDGEKVTLPETGQKEGISAFVGVLILIFGIGLGFKDKLKELFLKLTDKKKDK